MHDTADLIQQNRALLDLAEWSRTTSRRIRAKPLGDFMPLQLLRAAPHNHAAQTGPANPLIQRNRDLLARAEQARANAKRTIEASWDARPQRTFRIGRPALWADMMVAWVAARARASMRPLAGVATLERERALHLWRCALAISPASRPERLLSGPH